MFTIRIWDMALSCGSREPLVHLNSVNSITVIIDLFGLLTDFAKQN